MIALSKFKQALAGSYRRDGDAREQPMTLELAATRPSFLPRLSGPLEVEGRVSAPGLVADGRVSGRVIVNPLVPFAARYELELVAVDGRRLALSAERRPTPKSPFWSASTVRGEIRDAGGVTVARCELRLDYRRDLGSQLV